MMGHSWHRDLVDWLIRDAVSSDDPIPENYVDRMTDELRHLDRDRFRWRTIDGRILKMDDIEDSHLLNIERFLLGRGDLQVSEEYRGDHRRWSTVYGLIRDEIDLRGLTTLAEDAAGIAMDSERHDR